MVYKLLKTISSHLNTDAVIAGITVVTPAIIGAVCQGAAIPSCITRLTCGAVCQVMHDGIAGATQIQSNRWRNS